VNGPECVLFFQVPDVCHADQRFQKIPGILEELSPNHDKIIIFTNTPEEAEDVYKLRQTHDEHSKPVLGRSDFILS
jgi:hypothetical protein